MLRIISELDRNVNRVICMKAFQNWMNAREDQLLHLFLTFT
jgi:hypothetical protein